MAISMLKIRRPLGRLIFNMGIAIPGKTVFLIETAPCMQCIRSVTNLFPIPQSHRMATPTDSHKRSDPIPPHPPNAPTPPPAGIWARRFLPVLTALNFSQEYHDRKSQDYVFYTCSDYILAISQCSTNTRFPFMFDGVTQLKQDFDIHYITI